MSKKLKAAPRKVARANNRNAVPIEIREDGELITIPGIETYGSALRAMRSLEPFQIDVGVRYGAICEELECSGIGLTDLLATGGGSGGGCEGAVDRRLKMRDLRDRARAVLVDIEGLSPVRAARKAKGEADLGKKFGSKPAKGEVVQERQEISARRLVDMVCIGECSISQVLKAHGWPASGRSREKATAILFHALKAITSDWGGGASVGHRSSRPLVATFESCGEQSIAQAV